MAHPPRPERHAVVTAGDLSSRDVRNIRFIGLRRHTVVTSGQPCATGARRSIRPRRPPTRLPKERR
ncbi:hypothetical protein Ae406Ps2_1094c [Pseudonocardia sp. Ae406_Ps2]|nr:hypothetical protein Ae406Ps2_1094c [Pseudonocardia sp. Ae406_Ps2]